MKTLKRSIEKLNIQTPESLDQIIQLSLNWKFIKKLMSTEKILEIIANKTFRIIELINRFFEYNAI